MYIFVFKDIIFDICEMYCSNYQNKMVSIYIFILLLKK